MYIYIHLELISASVGGVIFGPQNGPQNGSLLGSPQMSSRCIYKPVSMGKRMSMSMGMGMSMAMGMMADGHE